MKSNIFKKTVAAAATIAMAAQFAFILPASAAEIYKQDYESAQDALSFWKAGEEAALKLVTGDATYGNYICYDFTPEALKGKNSRGAETTFKADTSGKDYYVVEFDAALKAGNNQNTDFAVKTSDFAYSGKTINDGAGAGYLFKITTTNSTTWTINDSSANTVELAADAWYHYKLIVDTNLGMTSATITDADGTTVLDKKVVGINGNAKDITGIYLRSGRYSGKTSVDNIVVRDKEDGDDFGELPTEILNSFSFKTTSDEGTVLPEKVTPPEEVGGDDTYYVDLSAVGTLGKDIFTEYPDKYTVDWSVKGLGAEDGYINIVLDDELSTNLTTSEGEQVLGSKATGASVNIRDGVSNWFAQITATIHFEDADGEVGEMTATKNFVVLSAAENASQILPTVGYPTSANGYADDLVGYKSGMIGIDSRDTLLDWAVYGGCKTGYIELAKEEETGDKYLDFGTGTDAGGSAVAEVNIGNITDEFAIDMVTKFTGDTTWGYYNTTPNNGGLVSAFTFRYNAGAITSGVGTVSGLENDKWYRIFVSCNRSVGTYSVRVMEEDGTLIGTIDDQETDDVKTEMGYFASSFGKAANNHRYIKSCNIYYPAVSEIKINSSAETISVPSEDDNDNTEVKTFEYNADKKELTVNMADVNEADLLVAKYDGDALASVTKTDLTFTEGRATANVEIAKTDKIFVWDSAEGMKPVLEEPVTGESILETSTGTATADLTAILTSTEGFPMSSEVTWEMDSTDENIVLEKTGAQTAKLSVSAGAPAGAVTITARCGSSYVEKTINLTTTGNSITFTKSASSMTIPFTGEEAVTAEFAACTINKDGEETEFAYDDDGNPTGTPAQITYTVLDKNLSDITDNMPAGVTFDTSTGILTVTSEAKSSVIYIQAKNNDQTPLSRSVMVNIHGLSFAFGSNAPADDSFTQVTNDAYSDKVGYGFADSSTVKVSENSVEGTADYRFKVKVPNGNYVVNVVTTSASMLSEVVENVPATTGITKTGSNFNVAVCDGVLDLTFLNGSTLSSVSITQAPEKTPQSKPMVYAIGDSTTNSTNPGFSWGNCVGSGVTVPDAFSGFSNNGMAGRDSVNFYNQGRVETVLLSICPGDYVTVNMGINSRESGEPASYYTLLDNYYVNGIIQRGGIPVIVTATPQGPVNGHEGNYSGGTFNCNRGKDAHNGDLRKIAQKYDLNIIELGYWGDDYFNSLTQEDATEAGKSSVLELVQSWYPDHNHYTAELGNVLGQYILDSVAEIAGKSDKFHHTNDPHINEQ